MVCRRPVDKGAGWLCRHIYIYISLCASLPLFAFFPPFCRSACICLCVPLRLYLSVLSLSPRLPLYVSSLVSHLQFLALTLTVVFALRPELLTNTAFHFPFFPAATCSVKMAQPWTTHTSTGLRLKTTWSSLMPATLSATLRGSRPSTRCARDNALQMVFCIFYFSCRLSYHLV